MHAGDECGATGGATGFGVIGHEEAAFGGNAVDVGGFADHEPAVVATGLHPADVVTHDEEDVGPFLRVLRGGLGLDRRGATTFGSKRDEDRADEAHSDVFPRDHVKALLSVDVPE